MRDRCKAYMLRGSARSPALTCVSAEEAQCTSWALSKWLAGSDTGLPAGLRFSFRLASIHPNTESLRAFAGMWTQVRMGVASMRIT